MSISEARAPKILILWCLRGMEYAGTSPGRTALWVVLSKHSQKIKWTLGFKKKMEELFLRWVVVVGKEPSGLGLYCHLFRGVEWNRSWHSSCLEFTCCNSVEVPGYWWSHLLAINVLKYLILFKDPLKMLFYLETAEKLCTSFVNWM